MTRIGRTFSLLDHEESPASPATRRPRRRPPASSAALPAMTGVAGQPVVYVVADDARARLAYRSLLGSIGYPVEDFPGADRFLGHADLEAAGCVILDLAPGREGAPRVQAALQAAGSPLAVVFVSGEADVPSAVDAMKLGACDYLLHPVRDQHLIDVVNRALRASATQAVKATARRSVARLLARLTAREHEVLTHLVEGAHYDEISRRLGITKRTVEAHRRRIMEKLEARTLPQLLRQLAHIGWPPRASTPPAPVPAGSAAVPPASPARGAASGGLAAPRPRGRVAGAASGPGPGVRGSRGGSRM
jgi:FixJ family two-component response regulator